MASYGALVRKITTAEVNRVLREGPYERWAYFVDEAADRVGVIFANQTTFAAYYVTDTPDPKLQEFGLEKISDLLGSSNPEYLVLTAGDNEFKARVFTSPMVLIEDDFQPSMNNDVLRDWQSYLVARGIKLAQPEVQSHTTRWVVAGAIIALIIAVYVAL